jgi:hypothetical protein
MQIDLGDKGADSSTLDYTSIPAGTYLVQIAEVRAGYTRSGDERWGVRLVVAEGEFTGRLAAWDSLVFNAKCQARLRHVFAALGLPARGTVDVEPDDLVGRRAFVEIRPSEYASPGGETIRRNEVPYAGYRAVTGDGPRDPSDGDERADDDGIPF